MNWILIVILAVLALVMAIGGFVVFRKKKEEAEVDTGPITRQQEATKAAIERMQEAVDEPNDDYMYQQALAAAKAKKKLEEEEAQKQHWIQTQAKRLESSAYLREAKRQAMYHRGVAVPILLDDFRKILYTDNRGLSFYSYDLLYQDNRIIDNNRIRPIEIGNKTAPELFTQIDIVTYGKSGWGIIDSQSGLLMPDTYLKTLSTCILDVIQKTKDGSFERVPHETVIAMIQESIHGDDYRLESVDMLDQLSESISDGAGKYVQKRIRAAIHQRRLEWEDEVKRAAQTAQMTSAMFVEPQNGPTYPESTTVVQIPDDPKIPDNDTIPAPDNMPVATPVQPPIVRPIESTFSMADPDPVGDAPEDDDELLGDDGTMDLLLNILNSTPAGDPAPAQKQPAQPSAIVQSIVDHVVEDDPIAPAPPPDKMTLPEYLQSKAFGDVPNPEDRDDTDDVIDMVNRKRT